MTESKETPDSNPAETPTTPFPAAPETTPVADAVPLVDAAPPVYAEQPPVAPQHGVHVPHHASDGAIAAMVIGTLLFGILAFGVGWTARGVTAHFQTQRAGMMGRNFSQDQNGLPQGHPDISGGTSRGRRHGYGQQNGQSQGYGQQQQDGQSSGWGSMGQGQSGTQSAPGQAAPAPGGSY